MDIGLAVTDVATERRYDAAVDGVATSLLTLPLRSDGATGDLLAVLSLRKVAGAAGGKHARPTGFHRDEETFARAIVQATGPFLFAVLTAASTRRQLEADVAAVERKQQARPPASCPCPPWPRCRRLIIRSHAAKQPLGMAVSETCEG